MYFYGNVDSQVKHMLTCLSAEAINDVITAYILAMEPAKVQVMAKPRETKMKKMS